MKTKKIETLNDFLKHLTENYDCKNCKPSLFIKLTLYYSIEQKAGAKFSPEIKKELTESETLEQAIKIIADNVDTKKELSASAQQSAEFNINTIVKLTQLKPIDAKKK